MWRYFLLCLTITPVNASIWLSAELASNNETEVSSYVVPAFSHLVEQIVDITNASLKFGTREMYKQICSLTHPNQVKGLFSF